jgi:hypothetical protein
MPGVLAFLSLKKVLLIFFALFIFLPFFIIFSKARYYISQKQHCNVWISKTYTLAGIWTNDLLFQARRRWPLHHTAMAKVLKTDARARHELLTACSAKK